MEERACVLGGASCCQEGELPGAEGTCRWQTAAAAAAAAVAGGGGGGGEWEDLGGVMVTAA